MAIQGHFFPPDCFLFTRVVTCNVHGAVVQKREEQKLQKRRRKRWRNQWLKFIAAAVVLLGMIDKIEEMEMIGLGVGCAKVDKSKQSCQPKANFTWRDRSGIPTPLPLLSIFQYGWRLGRLLIFWACGGVKFGLQSTTLFIKNDEY